MSTKETAINHPNYQQRFIDIIKASMPAHLSLANEIGTLLNLSQDSAYRRLRCETEFTLNEVVKICNHFDVPLEALNNERPNVITFGFSSKLEDEDNFYDYLQSIRNDLEKVNKFEKRKLFFAAEDIPVFYHFAFPELGAFKIFYWLKSILSFDRYQKQHFQADNIDRKLIETGKEIFKLYTQVPTVEVWTEETIVSTLQQIRFYWEAGFFTRPEDALQVTEQLQQVLALLQRMAEAGKKVTPEGSSLPHEFTLYQSELMIGNNCVLIHTDDKTSSYISYNTFNSMRTSNQFFNEQNERWMNNLISKSTLLSGVGEKQRNQFFKSIGRKVDELKNFIKS